MSIYQHSIKDSVPVYWDLVKKEYFITDPEIAKIRKIHFGTSATEKTWYQDLLAKLRPTLPVPHTERVEIEEVKVPTMPVLAGFEKTIAEEMDILATLLKGVAQPIIYTETPQGTQEINWKVIIPIALGIGLLIFGG